MYRVNEQSVPRTSVDLFFELKELKEENFVIAAFRK